jgi:hypothetical protein
LYGQNQGGHYKKSGYNLFDDHGRSTAASVANGQHAQGMIGTVQNMG